MVQRAKTVLKELEEENGVQYVAARKEEDQVSLTAIGEGEVLAALRRCQPDPLTPIEAKSLIYEWKQKLNCAPGRAGTACCVLCRGGPDALTAPGERPSGRDRGFRGNKGPGGGRTRAAHAQRIKRRPRRIRPPGKTS